MRLSIILPIYNVEKYIARCIESCCNQKEVSADDYELILVDDSSPDDSIDVAQKELEKYPTVNYRIITRPNGGLSAARNTGLEASQASYVWFVDSDDYIADMAVKYILDAIDNFDKPEIISFSYTAVYPSKMQINNMPQTISDRIISGIEYLQNYEFLSAWSRVYSRAFIRQSALKFTEGILWEDGEFNFKLFCLNKSNLCLNKNLYFYNRRPGSISTAGNVEKTLYSNLIIFDKHIEWLKQHSFNEFEQRILCKLIGKKIAFTLAGIPCLSDRRSRNHYFKEIKRRRKIFQSVCKRSGDWRLGLIYILYCVSPKVAAYLCYIKMQKILNQEYNLLGRSDK